MKWKFFVFLLIVISGGGVGYYLHSHSPDSGTRDYVQEVSAKTLLQHVQSLNSKLVLVNFWASWCEPCKVEFPNILQIRKDYAARGVQVVFVSIDDAADQLAAENFLRSQKVDFPTFFKGKQPLKFVTEIYPKWSGAVPTTLLIGADQKIVDAWEGDTTQKEFEERIERQLKVKGT